MGYYLNPSELASMFAVPASVTDKHLKLSSGEQLKVLLWCLRNTGAAFSVPAVCDALKMDEITVREALDYWCGQGVLCSTAAPEEPAGKKIIQSSAVKPGREETAKRGLECPEIAFILREAEQKFGRTLRQSEISTLVWLYDDQGVSASLLLMIVGYAVSEGRPNIGFIERTAVEWVNDGVSDIESAENRLVIMRRRRSAWHTVETAMGIERRSPSKSELETADRWVNEWEYGRDVIRAAYEACVDATSKFSMPYIKKIMAEWHKNGVKTVEDIGRLAKKEPAAKKNGDKYMDFVNRIIKDNEEG